MKDIKVNKVNKVNVNKREEETVINLVNKKTTPKASYSKKISYFLFAFMNLSFFCYIFFVITTFFFAIKEREIILEKSALNKVTTQNVVEENKKFLVLEKNKRSNISYINLTSNSSISLK